MLPDTVIIGAGPAGLFAAAQLNGHTLLLEKNELPGRKLMISGSGQCNLTHSGSIKSFPLRYGNAATFIRKSLFAYDNLRVVKFFNNLGVASTKDKNGKIFPSSLKAGDILNALIKAGSMRGAILQTRENVTNIGRAGDLFNITTGNTTYTARYLLIATGGLSYPATGSTGDGYRFAKALGHTVAETYPALTPVIVQNYNFAALQGITLPQARIALYRNKRKINEHTGSIVFTRNGLSGPGIIDFSRYIRADDILKVNVTPVTAEQLNHNLKQVSQLNGSMQLQTALKYLQVPRNLLLLLLDLAEAKPEMRIAEISKALRLRIAALLTELPFEVAGTGSYKQAMATTGGVVLSEVNSISMESLICPNLYFAGEVLNIDGDTGGFNIQAAFSTAYAAATSINEKLQKENQD